MHDLTPIIDFYEQLLDSEGSGPAAAGWQIPYAREVTYLSLARIDGLKAGSKILDVGCGTGGFKEFLDRAGIDVDYTGYDISPRVIERAKELHPDAKFEVRDILRFPPTERFDFVMATGALSFRVPDQGSYIVEMIRSMYAVADHGLGFSMLSAWAFMESPGLQRIALNADYAWPQDIFRYCKTLSRHVTLNNDAQHGGFEVFLYRNHVGALNRYLAYMKPGKVWAPDVEAAVKYHIELGLFVEMLSFLEGVETNAEVENHRGRAHLELGNREEALACFKKAIELAPTFPWPHVNLAKVAIRGRDLEGAVGHLRSAIAAAPESAGVREELAKALLAAGRRAEARVVVSKLPEGALRDFLLGATSDEPKDALAAYRRALTTSPNYLDATIAAAFACERLKDNAGALEHWRAAQLISPLDASIADRITAIEKSG